MSRRTITIARPLRYARIRDVTLNRGGVLIGSVVMWPGGRRAYLSRRRAEHYFIKHRGFGLDKALFWGLSDRDRIDMVVIEYTGSRGTRWFVSSIDDWLDHSVEVRHSKNAGPITETYGVQKVLCEDHMDELVVSRQMVAKNNPIGSRGERR